MQRTLWPLVVTVVMVACAPISRTASLPGSPGARFGPQPVSIDRATWQARAAFDSAARVGDVTGMAAFFAHDAVLISARGDSILGREAIGHYFAHLAGDATSADLRWAREGSLTMCVGGARERLVYTAHISNAGQTVDTVSGNLSVLWKRDAAGNLRIAWAALPEREIERRLRRSECRPVEDSVWSAWRLAVSVYPAPGFARTGATRSFEGVLRARGWVDVDCVCAGVTPNYTPVSSVTNPVAPDLIGIQYRFRDHMIAELVGGWTSSGSTMGAQTFSNRDYAQTRLTYSGTFMGALLSYELRGLQLGIGPALQLARWSLQDSLVPYSTGGLPSATESRWSTRPIGIVGDVRYHRLLGRRTFAAVRTQIRRFGAASTPATPRFPSTTVDQGSSFLGVGLGIVF